jgi:hypothetical protein
MRKEWTNSSPPSSIASAATCTPRRVEGPKLEKTTIELSGGSQNQRRSISPRRTGGGRASQTPIDLRYEHAGFCSTYEADRIISIEAVRVVSERGKERPSSLRPGRGWSSVVSNYNENVTGRESRGDPANSTPSRKCSTCPSTITAGSSFAERLPTCAVLVPSRVQYAKE